MTQLRLKDFSPYTVVALAVIAATYCLVSFHIPFTGDDLVFSASFNEQVHSPGDFVYYQKVHYYWSNARLADMLNFIPLNLMPLWLNALLNGVMTAAFFGLALLFATGLKRGNAMNRLIFTVLLAAALPWNALWMEFVCQYNYVWASAIAMAAVLAIVNAARLRLPAMLALAPFCLGAGAMHEACGASLFAGLCVYTLINRKNIGVKHLVLLLAFGVGVWFVLSSPPIWHRAEGASLPVQDSWGEVVLYSGYWVVILAVMLGYTAVFKRKEFMKFLHGDGAVFAVAAAAAFVFLLAARYVGRPGWYCQLFALVALGRMVLYKPFDLLNGRNYKIVATVLCALIVFHFAAVALWQRKVGQETRSVLARYEESADGVVFFDYTDDADAPAITLGKTHGVPDADDVHYLGSVARFIGGGKPLVILPAALADLDFGHFSGTLELGDSRGILAADPLGESEDRRFYEGTLPRKILEIGGVEHIETEFVRSGRTFFYYRPVEFDRGEK